MKNYLKTKGLLVILIAIESVVFAIGGYLIYKHELNKIYQSNEKILTSIATLKSNQISDWYLDEVNDITIIANHPFLAEVTNSWLRSNSLADKTRLTDHLMFIKNEHDYEDVFVVSFDGKAEAMAGNQTAVLHAVEQRVIEQVIIWKQDSSTELFTYTSDGEEKILISFISVIIDAENNVLGAVAGRKDISRFVYPLIDTWPGPSQTAASFIFMVEADSIVYLNNLRHVENPALTMRIAINQASQLASQAASGKMGLIFGKDYRGEDATGYVSKIEGTPWYLISKIDISELHEGKYAVAGVIAGIGFLVVLFTVFFIAAVYNQRQKTIDQELYRKEKEVWQQYEKFKITMDSLGDGVIVTDAEAKVQYMNNRAEALTGWRFREARGRYLGEVYLVKNEETGKQENNLLEKVVKKGIVKELANHTLLVSKNKDEIPVMDTAAPIYDADGSLTGIVITFQDETEKRTQYRLLKESEKNLRGFFENDITGDYSATAHGELLRCNPAFARMFGFNSPAELVGRNIKEFYRNPGERVEFLNFITVSGILKDFKITLKHKDGSDLICKENISGVFDESGNLVKYFGYLQDITQQKVAEEKLHIREQLLTSVMDTQQDLICRFLPDTTLTFVNKAYCKLFGKTEEELLGRTFLEHVPDSDREYISSNIKSLNEENPQITYENSAFKADGSIMTMEWTDIAIFNEEGKVVEFQSVGHDITEKLKTINDLKIAKEKAEESDRLKSAFLMNLSHEIRTPMNGIIGIINLLTMPDLSEDDKSDFINIIHLSGERLMNTINDIVEISKIEIGDTCVNYEAVNIAELMHYYLEFFKFQTGDKGLEFSIKKQIFGDTAVIKTDRHKMDSIMMNLIKNAIKFTCKGKIEIGNYIENGNLFFFVSDTGRGIPENKLEVIFDRFTQVEMGLSRGYEGSGIGLSIVKAHVDALDGTIKVVSEVDKGSTFTVSIPYLPQTITTGSKELNETEPPTQMSL